MSARLLRVFHDTHMGMGHKALADIAEKHVNVVNELKNGSILMFLNKRGDKLKILGSSGLVVGYLKMPGGERITLDALQYIPQTFGANGEIDYPKALKKALLKKLGTAHGETVPAPTAHKQGARTISQGSLAQ